MPLRFFWVDLEGVHVERNGIAFGGELEGLGLFEGNTDLTRLRPKGYDAAHNPCYGRLFRIAAEVAMNEGQKEIKTSPIL